MRTVKKNPASVRIKVFGLTRNTTMARPPSHATMHDNATLVIKDG